jgi:dTDP-4-dehydrorhamnose reductase
MKSVVLGAYGQLGSELLRQLEGAAIGWNRDACDIRDEAAVRERLGAVRPNVVINAAAYTQVDRAEDEPEACWAVNAQAVGGLARTCRHLDCRLVHISTDYVFGGGLARATPYRETDPPQPQGQYAKSKLAGERLAEQWQNHVIVRTCGLYGRPHPASRPNNFVETILRLARERDELAVVTDQTCTPSHTRDVARAVLYLAGQPAHGTYHVVNAGFTTWYDFAAEILKATGSRTPIRPISTAQFGAKAPRPSYSCLDTTKYQQAGGPRLPHWRDALHEYLASRS